MYTVAEISEILGITKPAVYKKLEKHKIVLESHYIIKDGVKKVDDEGLKILMATMGKNFNHSKSEINQYNEQVEEKYNKLYQQNIELYNQIIESLKTDKEILSKQIDALQERLKTEQENNRLYLLSTTDSKKSFLQRLFNK